MPKGYKTVSIKEDVHEKLEKLAEKTHRTVPGLISHLFETHGEKLEKLLRVDENAVIVVCRHPVPENQNAENQLVMNRSNSGD